MYSNPMNVKQKLYFVLPTATELVLYGLLIILTIIVSNVGQVQSWFYAAQPESITISNIVIKPLDNLLNYAFGDKSGYIAFALFWLIVGLVVFYGFMVARNFSSELMSDAAADKYIVPVGTDKYARLRAFLIRTGVQLAALVLLIIYIMLLVRSFFPYWVHAYTDIISKLPSQIWPMLLAIVSELIMIHIMVVLVRLLFLRKRVLGER